MRIYVCPAQRRNLYNSGNVVHKVRIFTLLRLVEIFILHETIPKYYLRQEAKQMLMRLTSICYILFSLGNELS